MTDTALYADLVLPATTFLEGYDFAKAYGPINMEMALPVVDAVGEARSNADVFGDLCARLGLLNDGEPTGELDLMLHVLDALPGTIGDDLARGRAAGAAVRRRADSVRRRLSEHAGSEGGPLPRRARRQRADGPPSVPAGSRHRAAIRWRSSRRQAIERSARRSASCRGPTSS